MQNKSFIQQQRRARGTRCQFLFGVLVASGLLITAGVSAAEDQSYQALRQWIEQHRDATPTFTPGQHLTEQDRKALESFIPQSAWRYYFFPGMDMEIRATEHYPLPAEWGQKVRPGYRLDENGVLIDFTGGGFPFPEIKPDDPQAATQVIWNMLWRPGADDYVMPMRTWLRGEGGRLDREIELTAVQSRYAQGTHCLVPGYEEVRSKMLMEFRSPRDMAGTKQLQFIYVDHSKEDDGWLYMPSQRKPRRVSASERTTELLGMDYIQEDMMGFGGKVYEHTWTYLGKKAVLATVNVKDNPELGGPHLWVPHKARWEVREAHVVLIAPKSPTHPYSHKIVFVDAEHFWALWMFAFDREQEKLLRMNQHFLKYSESYAQEPSQQAPYLEQDFSNNVGHHVFLHLGETDIHAQKPHATITHCYPMLKDFTAARAKQFYGLRNMVGGRR